MTFERAQIEPDGTAKLIYSVAGGETPRPMPAGKDAPANTLSADWDHDTLTLTCHLDDDSTHPITLTEAEI
ncbi:hypothetical protein [Ruficoccus sp. ZRK36]|uniref:hypothetical protein n=1 Tax=Ruficoccus sp. ZRK36 TaxID=2866311 RepID=UPI001C72AECB|nr:hypothetical protein [Ruficoccus sp. ZRK36]QYY35315.1 hypothetical protein K0V07_13565 [Ruficoccus sp. ZRK36]